MYCAKSAIHDEAQTVIKKIDFIHSVECELHSPIMHRTTLKPSMVHNKTGSNNGSCDIRKAKQYQEAKPRANNEPQCILGNRML